MKAHHTFRSIEREKLEIIASLLQQAGYRITRITPRLGELAFKATRDGVHSGEDEQARVGQLVEHFNIKSWSVMFT